MSSSTVVIPCYNEEQRLDVAAFDRYLGTDLSTRLLFVNDGSHDETLAVLRRIESAHPFRVDVIDLEQNKGKAEAVRTGVCFALERGADYVGYWDADLATPLEAITDFARVLDRRRGIDAVIGTRLPLLGRSIRRNPRRNRLGRLFAWTASQVLDINISDTQCGAKMFRATPSITAAFARPFRSRWIFDVEILARLAQFASRKNAPTLAECVYELPLDDWADVAGSKLRPRDFLKAPWELAVIYVRYLSWLQSPMPSIEALPRVTIPLSTAQAAERVDDVDSAASNRAAA